MYPATRLLTTQGGLLNILQWNSYCRFHVIELLSHLHLYKLFRFPNPITRLRLRTPTGRYRYV